jgi:hypothetical protein
MSFRHIAVVPVFDEASRAALQHAAGLAPEVVAIGFTPDAPAVDGPLLIIDAPHESWTVRVERAIATLKRNERPDRITLVLPESLAALFAESSVEVASV